MPSVGTYDSHKEHIESFTHRWHIDPEDNDFDPDERIALDVVRKSAKTFVDLRSGAKD